MFRLIRWCFSLVLFASFLWFATSVQLGKRTLWGHLRAIWATQAAQDLATGTRQEAAKVAGQVRRALHDGGVSEAKASPPSASSDRLRHDAPLDPVDAHDQDELDKLVRRKAGRHHVERSMR